MMIIKHIKLAFILIILPVLFPDCLAAIGYSAFAPELTYTPYMSLMSDNYTTPEPSNLPATQDSIEWEIPIRNRETFKRFGKSMFSDYRDTNAIFRYRYKNQGLDFFNRSNFIQGYEGTFFPGEQFNYYYIGFNQQAWLNNRWNFHSQFTSGSLRGSEQRIEASPMLDSFHKYYGRHYEFNNCTAGINYQDNIIKAALGRGRLNIGNSITGSILLNDRVNDYAYLSAEFRIGNFVMSLMNAELVADSTLAVYDNNQLNDKNFPNKYFVAHQFSWVPVDNFHFFAGETLVYGNTSFNFNYLLPQAYYRVLADSDHDRDNATMYTGFDWTLHKQWLFYFNFMMDELRPEKLLHNWWGNKYAYQGGISYKIPYEIVEGKAPRFTVEMTAVRPWTYTHYLMYDKYTQDNRCLGFPMGANLLHYAAKLSVPLPWDCSYTGYVSYMRQGSFGSNFLTNSDDYVTDSYNDTANWLQGVITNTTRVENSFRIGILKHHKLFLSQAAEKHTNSKWDNQIVFGWHLDY